MTQQQFAAAIGATKAMVSKWERGTIPRRAQCDKILSFTGGEVTPSHFVLADVIPSKPRPAKRQEVAA